MEIDGLLNELQPKNKVDGLTFNKVAENYIEVTIPTVNDMDSKTKKQYINKVKITLKDFFDEKIFIINLNYDLIQKNLILLKKNLQDIKPVIIPTESNIPILSNLIETVLPISPPIENMNVDILYKISIIESLIDSMKMFSLQLLFAAKIIKFKVPKDVEDMILSFKTIYELLDKTKKENL